MRLPVKAGSTGLSRLTLREKPKQLGLHPGATDDAASAD